MPVTTRIFLHHRCFPVSPDLHFLPSVMQISPGVRVGAFEIRALVGAGGMGTVYRAHDTRLGRDVAIKILQEKHSSRTDYLRRFEREARSASALNHPNIVTIFEINEFDGAPFIAMELIEGTRIRDLLRDGPIPLRKLLTIATQIADGLAAAHDRAIVHRDIKPENVMITKQGLVKILDFGLARPVIKQAGEESSSGGFDAGSDAITSETITREIDQRLLGTAGYMSPEQATAGAVDYRSDQFSFGALLYEMATGRRAFAGGSIGATIQAIIREEPIPMRQLNAKLPAPLCWIVDRCLAKDPTDRYASTTDLAHELHTLRDRLPDTGPNIKALPFSAMSRRTFALVAAAAAAAIFLATAVGIWNRGDPQRPSASTADAHVAVLPFQDLTGRPDGAQFSRGLAEVVSARLRRFSSIQVVPPTSTTELVAEGANDQRIARELGVTWVVKATVERIGNALKVRYTLFDSVRDQAVATDTVRGSVDNLWALQDELTRAIVSQLGLEKSPPDTDRAELETPEEQDLYVRALGCLIERHEDPDALDTGIALLRQLAETSPDSPLVHAALARTYLEKFNLTHDQAWSEKARQASDRARTLAPDSPDVVLAQATVQQFTARFTEAIDTYKRALSLQPNSPEALLGLAKCYDAAGDPENAERTFLRSVRLRPSWWSSHNELGHYYQKHARYDEAAREYQKVIESAPQVSWGYSNLGAMLIMGERLPEAMDAFHKALSIREDPAARANLGYCYYYLGRYKESAEAYRKATATVPLRASYWAGLADACRWTICRDEVTKANAKAIELLKQDLIANPKSARAYGSLAVVLAQTGHRSEAERHIRIALDIEPDNPARMFQAGRVANLNGNHAEAVKWFRQALDAKYGRIELPRDPEFAQLRKSEPYRAVFPLQIAAR